MEPIPSETTTQFVSNYNNHNNSKYLKYLLITYHKGSKVDQENLLIIDKKPIIPFVCLSV
jgi:hypothetical protein